MSGGKGKKVTVGYRYFMGLHFGLCHSPVDAFMELRGGDRTAWAGEGYEEETGDFGQGSTVPGDPIGEVTESQRIRIYAPELWGGEKREGGIDGYLDVMMGEDTQAPNDYLAAQIPGPMPAFRGMLSLVFRGGMVAAMNPYPKPWKFRVRRILKGWHGGEAWYPEKAPVLVGNAYALPADAEGWEYQVLDEEEDPGNTNLTPPADGWSTGQAPFGGGSGSTGNTTWPIKTVLWARRALTLPAHITQYLEVVAENGCVVWVNGEEVGAVNRSNVQIPNNQENTFSFQVTGGGTVELLIKAFDEEGTGGLTALSASMSSPGVMGMNPAHITYEALTNPDWGLGYPPAVLDLDSFAAAADVFYAEGLGLCLQWVRQDSVEGFIQDIMNHAGAVLAQDPRTALFRLLPIRGDYITAELPELRRGLNVLSVESFQRAAVTETVNEIIAEFTDASTGKKGSLTVQHLANIQAQGGIASQTVRYPGAPNAALAERLALRDLNARALPLCKVKLTADRSAASLLPGEVVRWSDDVLGIVDMPLRVLQVNYGSLTDGRVVLDLAEDVFGLPATGYLGQQGPGWQEPERGPAAPPASDAFEAPYVTVLRSLGATLAGTLTDDAGFLAMAAAPPSTTSYGFQLRTRTGSGAFAEVGTGGTWSPGGVLTADVGPLDTVLTLAGATGYDEMAAGQLAMLGTGDDAELVRLDAGDPTAATVTVGRGVADTVAKAWPLGTRFWVIEDAAANDPTEYATAEEVDAKALTETTGGVLAEADAPTDTVVMDQRQARPYPPGLFRINAEAYPEALTGALTVTWAHRDRLLQADTLRAEGEASIGPEPGTTYTLRAYLDGDLVDTQAGLTGTTATTSLGADGVGRIELEAVRDGLTSWQLQAHEFDYTAATVATRITDAGDRRITDAGDTRTLDLE